MLTEVGSRQFFSKPGSGSSRPTPTQQTKLSFATRPASGGGSGSGSSSSRGPKVEAESSSKEKVTPEKKGERAACIGDVCFFLSSFFSSFANISF